MVEYKSEQWDQIRTVVRDALGLERAGHVDGALNACRANRDAEP